MKTKLITLFVVLMGVLNTFGQNFYVTTDSSTNCVVGGSTTYLNLTIGDNGLRANQCRNIYWKIDVNSDDFRGMMYNYIAVGIASKTKLLDLSNANIQAYTNNVYTNKGSYYAALYHRSLATLLYGSTSIYNTQADSMLATKLDLVTYPANELPIYAFTSCVSLTQIILPKTLTKVNMNAFIGCRNLDSLVIPSTTFVPTTEKLSTVFNSCYLPQNRVMPPLTVYVPANLVDTYKADEYWGELDIQPISTATNTKLINKSNVRIYPTVVNSELNISGVEQGEISIIDLNGNIVLRTNVENQINVGSLTKGMYMVMVDGNCVGKIIKR